MRLIKMLGLATVAAMAAMAFVGVGSASAANTVLCATHTALTCSLGRTSVTVNNAGQGVGTLLNDLADVLCLTISGEGTPLELANPQQVHISSLWFTQCGTNSSHNNCTVSVLELPLANLNKTGLDSGTLTGTNGEFWVNCSNIDIFGTDISCIYDFTGLQLSVGAQHLTANETPIEETGTDFLCPEPEEPTLDGLLWTILGNSYVLA